MNLRTQMLLAGALTLAVPIIGWQSVTQLDTSLRQIRADEQSLKVVNARLALAESSDLQDLLGVNLTRSNFADLYAEEARYPLFVDGYDDDWQHLNADARFYWYSDNKPETVSVPNDALASFSVRLAKRAKRLFVLFKVKDANVVYHQPPVIRADLGEGEHVDQKSILVNGDAIELFYLRDGKAQHVLLRAIAPGPVPARVASDGQGRGQPGDTILNIDAYWVSSADGYQLEVSLPLPDTVSPFAMALVDVDSNDSRRSTWIGTTDPASMQNPTLMQSAGVAGRLYFPSDLIQSKLKPWVTQGTRARLFDGHGRLLSDVNQLYQKTDEESEYDPASRGFFNAVLFRLFAYFVSDTVAMERPFQFDDSLHLAESTVESVRDADALTRQYITSEQDRVLGSLVVIGGENPNGFILFESNEDLASAYSASRVARLFSLLTLVSLLAGLILLVYASLLSMRIRRLSQQANRAVSAEGQIQTLPHSKAKDEIGELTRNLSALLTRTSGYTQYLEALSSRLSHELRTPLSVVKTSIENLDRAKLDQESVILLDRASGGADQLHAIIRALVESTRLEQTVQQAEMERINMTEWMNGALQRYQQIYPDKRFELSGREIEIDSSASAGSMFLLGSPELLQQAFDKLVDNAVGFSSDGLIMLSLLQTSLQEKFAIRLSVTNNGPQVAEQQLAHLFDPMYTKRDRDDGQLHMGLGLYIVRMITDAHAGRCWAENSAHGMRVGLDLPGVH